MERLILENQLALLNAQAQHTTGSAYPDLLEQIDKTMCKLKELNYQEDYELIGVDSQGVVPITTFNKGQSSRFNKPFSYEIALREAKSFIEARGKDFQHIKLVTTSYIK